MKPKTLLTIFLVIVALLAIYYITSPRSTLEAPDIRAASSTKPVDTFEAISYTIEKDAYENGEVAVTIAMPVVTGLKSKAINDAVNVEIQRVFDTAKKGFLDDTKDTKILSEEQKNQLTLEGSAPVSAREKTFYVEINAFSYYSGAAHPLSQKIVLNFVKETGQLIRLEDMLKKDALTGISYLAKPKILEQLAKGLEGSDDTQTASDVFEESGTLPTSENYQTFYLKHDSIDWVFGQYQVAPYVFGEIAISIPLRDLKPLLVDREWLR